MTSMGARALAWARSVGGGWWTPVDAAAALGIPEDEMREALGELEAAGLIYRAVSLADSWRITADGADAVEGTKEGKRRGDDGDDREA